MNTTTISTVAACILLGCGASMPSPTQDLAEAQSAQRSATDLGAANQPTAKLHLQLSQEQIAQATIMMKNGDNVRADGLLLRAKSDAELAIALTRDQSAQTEANRATDQSNAQHATNVNQGATQ
jgi:hypothetical protein